MNRLAVREILAWLSSTFLICGAAVAQDEFPSRPITMIVWSGPGMMDTVTRVVSRVAEKTLGQPIIVENKPGGSGVIGINHVLKSKPDGYTIGVTTTNTNIIAPHIRELPYNVLTESVDVMTLTKYNFGLAVRADAPWNTFEEVIEYARSNPGKFSFASAGVGGTHHVAMERIAIEEKISFTQVPFKSGGEAVAACLGGHTNAVAQGSADLLPQIEAGKLKMLLVLDDKRWPVLPDVPTMAEKGYDFYAMSYISIFAPKGVPNAALEKLERAFRTAMDDSSFVETLKKFQVEPVYMSGKDYSELWRSKYEGTGRVVKAMGLSERR